MYFLLQNALPLDSLSLQLFATFSFLLLLQSLESFPFLLFLFELLLPFSLLFQFLLFQLFCFPLFLLKNAHFFLLGKLHWFLLILFFLLFFQNVHHSHDFVDIVHSFHEVLLNVFFVFIDVRENDRVTFLFLWFFYHFLLFIEDPSRKVVSSCGNSQQPSS